LTAEQLAHLVPVEKVAARPPSLYVTLDTAAWNRLPEQDRRDLIEEVGRLAGSRGYLGVHLRTRDGTTVGEWLSEIGSRLVTPPPEAS
jgi:hypothetical protein